MSPTFALLKSRSVKKVVKKKFISALEKKKRDEFKASVEAAIAEYKQGT